MAEVGRGWGRRHKACASCAMPALTPSRPRPQPATLPQSLRTSKKEQALDARLRALSDQITGDVYVYVTTGLFEAHKLLFSFQLAVKVLEAGPSAPDPQVRGPHRGGASDDAGSPTRSASRRAPVRSGPRRARRRAPAVCGGTDQE